jgi:WD40 repeat protein
LQEKTQALERERHSSYYQRIALADREWAVNNLRGAEQLLDACPADLRGWEWRYLKGKRLQGHPPLKHPSAVFTAVFSPDGRWIASGSQDGSITVWDAITGEQGFSFQAHDRQGHVRCLAFSPDGGRLASASWDKTVKVWNFDPLREAKLVPRLPPLQHPKGVTQVAFSPDGTRLASGGDDRCVRVWDVTTGEQVLAVPGHESVAFSPDGHYLAAQGKEDATVGIWDAHTGQRTALLAGHNGPVMSLRFSKDGRWLATATGDLHTKADGEIKVWDVQNWQEVRTLRGHTGAVLCVAFSPDGQRLASAGMDEGVNLWDLRSHQPVLVLRDHRSWVRSVEFSLDGNVLISASHDSTVRLWDATPLQCGAGQEACTLDAPCGGFTNAVFSPDARWLTCSGKDGQVRVWDLTLPRPAEASPRLLPGPAYGGKAAFSPDGKLFASGCGYGHTGGCFTVFDATTWTELYRDGEAGSPVAFSSDSQYLAAVGAGFAIEIREATTGQQVRPPLRGHGWAILDLAFRPSGNSAQLASASMDGTVRIWDVLTGEHRALLRQTEALLGVAFSHDGRYLATGGQDRVIKIWDTATWQRLDELRDATGCIQSVAFHPRNPGVLAWGGTDGTVKVVQAWDAPNKEIRTLHGHTSWVEGVAFSPDGNWIASSSLDGTIKLWKVALLSKAPDAAVGIADGGP